MNTTSKFDPTKSKNDAPLYQQVVEQLRQHIAQGRYPVGSQLPAEDDLRDSFGVSRHTIREALRCLKAEGLLSSRRGAGTTVTSPSANGIYVQEVHSIEDLIQYAKTIRYRPSSCEMITCDKALAQEIGAERGSDWLKFDGLRYQEGLGQTQPVCHTTVYVTSEYAGVARLIARANSAIYQLIEDLYAIRIVEVDQVFRGVDASESVAQELGLAAGEQLVEIKRSYRTASGQLAEVSINLYPLKIFNYTMKIRRQNHDPKLQ